MQKRIIVGKQSTARIHDMKNPPIILLLLSFAGLLLSSCQSARVENKAKEYLRNGAARDMAEAQRMAENYYWPDSARSQEALRQK